MVRYAEYVSRLRVNDLYHQSVTQHKACCFTCTTWFVDVLLYFTDIKKICLRIINFILHFIIKRLPRINFLLLLLTKVSCRIVCFPLFVLDVIG